MVVTTLVHIDLQVFNHIACVLVLLNVVHDLNGFSYEGGVSSKGLYLLVADHDSSNSLREVDQKT
jgi:hypothetical protein